jgi:hypothetical protein
MITQTYTFRDLPKWIRENENGKRDSFIDGVRLDIAAEFEDTMFPPVIVKSEMDVTGRDLHITFAVEPTDARFLEIALHNLHQAKLLN